MSGDFHTDADHGFPYSQDVITRLHGMAEVYRHFSQGKEVGTADLLDEAAGCISALMENMSAPSRGPYLMPLAVRLASERVRADAANTMRHDTTSDLSARLMCRVGVHDLGLVMAWVDQFASRPDADTTERQPSPREEQNPSASPKEVSPTQKDHHHER